MTDDRKIDQFPAGQFLIGGKGGLIYKDFRFGGFGFGNSWEKANTVGGKWRNAEYSLGGGGLFLEYNHAFNSNMGLALGAMLGAGNMTFSAKGNDLGINREWDTSQSFFMAYPYLGIWGGATKWSWIQLDAGWLFFDLDHSRHGFENKLGTEMVDDNLRGGFMLGLEINFGYNPVK
jgi:hypothetical protein